MKLFSLVLFIMFSSFCVSQNDEQEKAIETITTFFEGFHNQDSVLIKSVVYKAVVMQSISENTNRNLELTTTNFSDFIKQIVAIPKDHTFSEKLLSYSVQIDGNMANVWTPYQFWYNDKLSHCGVNSFQLLKVNQVWKIFYLVDTRSKCQE